jgi:hypothetical protein
MSRGGANERAARARNMIITVPQLAAEALGSFLASEMRSVFGSTDAHLLAELLPSLARVALNCIGNSDALYHNVEHTMLVTLVARDILSGRALLVSMSPEDYAHLLAACLLHDIGYVRGILRADDRSGYVVDETGRKVSLPRGSSDAALQPYRVDRSKLFVLDRVKAFDAGRIARMIEATRFPPSVSPEKDDLDEEGSLMQAADLIGQLGDPHFLRKVNALYHEFEEAGINQQRGYKSPVDLVQQYPHFYWSIVSPRIQTAIRYLSVTANGRQWIANLYSNVFRAERDPTWSNQGTLSWT